MRFDRISSAGRNPMDDRQKIAVRRAQLEAELAELMTAERVLNRLNATPADKPRRQKANGAPAATGLKTISDFARSILSANADGVHFTEIADTAVEQGYHGRKGSSPKAVRQSFWATMRRDEITFQKLGGGKFKLK